MAAFDRMRGSVRHFEFMRAAAVPAAQAHAQVSDPAERLQIHLDAAFDVVSYRRTSKYEGADFHALGTWLRLRSPPKHERLHARLHRLLTSHYSVRSIAI